MFKKKKKTSEQAPASADAETLKEAQNSLFKGVPDLQDILARPVDRSDQRLIRVGSSYARTLMLPGLPGEIDIGWLRPLMDGDIDFAVHVEPYDEAKALDALVRQATQIESSLRLMEGDLRMVQQFQKALDDTWDMHKRIVDGLGRLYSVTVAATVHAPTAEESLRRTKALETHLRGRSIYAQAAEARMDEGYMTTFPVGLNLCEDAARNLDSEGVSACFPFFSADLMMPGGYPLGVNRATGAPVIFNPFSPWLKNYNMIIYAPSGAGKSTAVKIMIPRSTLIGQRWRIIDPEGEYLAMARELDLPYVAIGPGSDVIENPFDLEATQERSGRLKVNLSLKVQDMARLIKAMVEGEGAAERDRLSPQEEAVLEEAIRQEYAACGVTTDPDSLYVEEQRVFADGTARYGRFLRPMPTLTSLWERLQSMPDQTYTSRLVAALAPWLRGRSLGFFDGQTNVWIGDAPIVVYDITALERGRERLVGLQAMLGSIWERFAKKNPEQPKGVLVDEAWRFARYEPAMEYLEDMVRRMRKRTCSLVLISQDFRAFQGTERGKAVNSNSDVQLFLRQESADIQDLAALFRLSEGEIYILQRARKGEGILRVGGTSVPIRFVPSPEERRWCFTSNTQIEDADEAAEAEADEEEIGVAP